ncbi:MAG: hypothetical protein CSB47_11370 [Proteobacteria bacterium]|nr:MAG: hypothetical protein CSB47_11370 [Pseudomonadota bacterium]
MMRLTLILVVLLGLLILLGVIYVAYRKIREGIGNVWSKGVEVANEQQERWKQREKIKSQPDFVQKAHQQSEQIKYDTKALPAEWQERLTPLNAAMQGVMAITISDDKCAEKVRSFFNTSLPAYAAFVAKLKSDYRHLDEQGTNKAKESLSIFKQDFERYLEQIQQARRFDFDVLMDVIKVRLKDR